CLAVDYHKKGIIYSYLEDYVNALKFHKKSASIRKGLNDVVSVIRINNGMGFLNILGGKYKTAYKYYSRAVNDLVHIRDYNEIAVTLYNFSLLYLYTGNYGQCIVILDKILKLMGIMKMTFIPFQSLVNIQVLKALAYFKNGQKTKALEYYNIIKKSEPMITGESRFFYGLLQGHIYNEQGKTKEAGEFFMNSINETTMLVKQH